MELYIVNGFLGAGKTTFIRGLLRLWAGRRVAVVVNEFGETGLDGQMLAMEARVSGHDTRAPGSEGRARMPELRAPGSDVQSPARAGLVLAEINGGSIFCSCRSDQFIDALIKLAGLDLDAVVVESSGLADPGGMGGVIRLLHKLSGGAYDYRGSLTLIDALGYEDIRYTAMIHRKQVVYSDLLLLNKADLVSESDLVRLEAALRELNPFAPVRRTVYAKIDRQALDEMRCDYSIRDTDSRGGNVIGIQKLQFRLEGDFRLPEIEAWLEGVRSYLFRIKGFVMVDGVWGYIDSTAASVEVKPGPFSPEEPVAVLLAAGNQPVRKQMEAEWQRLFAGSGRALLWE